MNNSKFKWQSIIYRSILRKYINDLVIIYIKMSKILPNGVNANIATPNKSFPWITYKYRNPCGLNNVFFFFFLTI